jgi:acylphosphatase
MAENIKTYKVILSGRVQGVGFRFYVESIAGKYDVKGYVRNTINGKVEVVCQGEDGIYHFREEIKKGPSFSVVADVKVEEFESSRKYSTFEIRY